MKEHGPIIPTSLLLNFNDMAFYPWEIAASRDSNMIRVPLSAFCTVIETCESFWTRQAYLSLYKAGERISYRMIM